MAKLLWLKINWKKPIAEVKLRWSVIGWVTLTYILYSTLSERGNNSFAIPVALVLQHRLEQNPGLAEKQK
jgi:hypothetical protein